MSRREYFANLAETSPGFAARLRERGDGGRRKLRRRSHSLRGGEVLLAASFHRCSSVSRTTSPQPRHNLAAYDRHLEALQQAGQILWRKFEGLKLRLADNTFYTPDFAVLASDGVMECHEVKGYWEDDARVKVKVAASLYPFRFIAVTVKAKRDGGGWHVEEF